MKKITLFVLLSIFIIQLCTAQAKYTYKFVYETTYQPKKNDSKKYTEDMVLLTDTKSSIYVSPTKIIIDSIRKEYKAKGFSPHQLNQIKKKYPKNNIHFLIKKTKNKFTIQSLVTIYTIEYTQKTPNFNWKIKNKTIKILGYTCQLATTRYKGRDYEAWFCPKIAIPDGPYKFAKLPGLIFKIYDTQKQYEFVLKAIVKENKYFPKLATKSVIKTTKENYTKVVKNTINGFVQRIYGDTKIKMKKLFKESRENSNPIELER